MESEEGPVRLTGRPLVDGESVDVATAHRRLPVWRIVVALAVVALLARAILFLVQTRNFQWDVVRQYLTFHTVMHGLVITIVITLSCTALSIVVGAPIAVFRLSGSRALSLFGAGYVWLFRGLPALVQIVFWFNLAYLLPRISIGIPFGPSFHSWSTNDVITPFAAAVLGLGLTEAAYVSEIIRGGMLSVDAGQVDAARSLGLGGRKTMFQIVVPQAMRYIIPPMASQVIGLAKSTSLVSVVATTDLLFSVEAIYSRTFQVIPLLLVACVWYLVLVTVLMLFQTYLERRFSRGRGAGSSQGANGFLGRGRFAVSRASELV